MDSDVISVVTLSPMSSVDAARYTMTSPSRRSTIRLSSRTSPSMPGNGSPLPIVWPAVIGSPIGGSPSISGLDAKTSPSTETIWATVSSSPRFVSGGNSPLAIDGSSSSTRAARFSSSVSVSTRR